MLRPFTSLRTLLRPAVILDSFAHHGAPTPWLRSSFTTSRSVAVSRKQLPQRPKHPPESEFEESFLKGSGPGGQKINKTSSAVQLIHHPTGLVVKCQATRSRSQNRKIARDLLALKLDALHNGAASRTAVIGDVKRKKAASKAKKSRRKYKKLEEGVEDDGNGEVEEGEGAGEGGIEEAVVEGREVEGEQEQDSPLQDQGRGLKGEEELQDQQPQGQQQHEGIRDGQEVGEAETTERQDTNKNTKNEG